MRDDDLAEAIEVDFETADLPDRTKEMVRYGLKLNAKPGEMSEKDVQRLRDAGFGDRDILHIVEVVAYYAYANRIADGLGIPLEEWIEE